MAMMWRSSDYVVDPTNHPLAPSPPKWRISANSPNRDLLAWALQSPTPKIGHRRGVVAWVG